MEEDGGRKRGRGWKRSGLRMEEDEKRKKINEYENVENECVENKQNKANETKQLTHLTCRLLKIFSMTFDQQDDHLQKDQEHKISNTLYHNYQEELFHLLNQLVQHQYQYVSHCMWKLLESNQPCHLLVLELNVLKQKTKNKKIKK